MEFRSCSAAGRGGLLQCAWMVVTMVMTLGLCPQAIFVVDNGEDSCPASSTKITWPDKPWDSRIDNRFRHLNEPNTTLPPRMLGACVEATNKCQTKGVPLRLLSWWLVASIYNSTGSNSSMLKEKAFLPLSYRAPVAGDIGNRSTWKFCGANAQFQAGSSDISGSTIGVDGDFLPDVSFQTPKDNTTAYCMRLDLTPNNGGPRFTLKGVPCRTVGVLRILCDVSPVPPEEASLLPPTVTCSSPAVATSPPAATPPVSGHGSGLSTAAAGNITNTTVRPADVSMATTRSHVVSPSTVTVADGASSSSSLPTVTVADGASSLSSLPTFTGADGASSLPPVTEKKSFPRTTIIYAAVGGAAFLVIAIVVMALLVMHCRRRRKENGGGGGSSCDKVQVKTSIKVTNKYWIDVGDNSKQDCLDNHYRTSTF